MIYLISYDLKQPNRDYTALYNSIKNLGNWWHYLESTWLVQPTGIYSIYTVAQVSEMLRDVIDSNDRLMVVKIDPLSQSADGWLEQDAWTWIRDHSI